MKPTASSALGEAGVSRRQGFSLIEMLISLAIMLILFTMLFGFGSRRNQKTKKEQCQANLQKLYISLQIYANEQGDWFPRQTNAVTSEAALDVLVPRYAADSTIFVCPGSKDRPLPPGASLQGGRISYAYYMGRRQMEAELPLMSDRQVDTKPKVVYGQVFSDDGKKPANNHHKYGGAYLLCDGSTRSSGPTAPMALPLGTNVVLLNPKP
jgi:prepilin-type N-terminal cleavage/methylation domain-containing protein